MAGRIDKCANKDADRSDNTALTIVKQAGKEKENEKEHERPGGPAELRLPMDVGMFRTWQAAERKIDYESSVHALLSNDSYSSFSVSLRVFRNVETNCPATLPPCHHTTMPPCVPGSQFRWRLRIVQRVSKKSGRRNMDAVCPWRPNLETVTHFWSGCPRTSGHGNLFIIRSWRPRVLTVTHFGSGCPTKGGSRNLHATCPWSPKLTTITHFGLGVRKKSDPHILHATCP